MNELRKNKGRYALVVLLLLTFLLAADPVALKVQGPDTTGNPQQVTLQGLGTAGSFQTPVSGSAIAGNSTNSVTLAGAAGKTTYICGFVCTSGGATAANTVNVTVTNTPSGTLTYCYGFPAGVTISGTPLVVNFNPPLPASGQNTAIVVSLGAGGAGNLLASCVAWGYQQ